VTLTLDLNRRNACVDAENDPWMRAALSAPPLMTGGSETASAAVGGQISSPTMSAVSAANASAVQPPQPQTPFALPAPIVLGQQQRLTAGLNYRYLQVHTP
jgi:hypothetical protein